MVDLPTALRPLSYGPPGNCPRCLVITCLPFRLRRATGWDGVIAYYFCAPCRHSWWTSWSNYGLDLPPGWAGIAGAA